VPRARGPAASAPAPVHPAECYTPGASASSHPAFGNVSRLLYRTLLIPGVLGAILGAYILSSLPGEKLAPYIAAYLIIMGLIIILKAFRLFPPKNVTTHLAPLGFIGALVDTMGGGGWGPIVATNLIVRGNKMSETIGSVNAVEFFVTLAASVTFVLTLGLSHWKMIIGLAIGGVIAAPFGAYLCKRIPVRPFMVFVGILVVVISSRTLLRSLN
jgi:uncharacterized membrane protein YfcA